MHRKRKRKKKEKNLADYITDRKVKFAEAGGDFHSAPDSGISSGPKLWKHLRRRNNGEDAERGPH